MITDDPAVFYGTDFAQPATRQRSGVPDLAMDVILGEVDREALDGHAVAPERAILFARADVAPGDRIISDGITYVVRDVRAIADGADMTAWLRKT